MGAINKSLLNCKHENNAIVVKVKHTFFNHMSPTDELDHRLDFYVFK